MEEGQVHTMIMLDEQLLMDSGTVSEESDKNNQTQDSFETFNTEDIEQSGLQKQSQPEMVVLTCHDAEELGIKLDLFDQHVEKESQADIQAELHSLTDAKVLPLDLVDQHVEKESQADIQAELHSLTDAKVLPLDLVDQHVEKESQADIQAELHSLTDEKVLPMETKNAVVNTREKVPKEDEEKNMTTVSLDAVLQQLGGESDSSAYQLISNRIKALFNLHEDYPSGVSIMPNTVDGDTVLCFTLPVCTADALQAQMLSGNIPKEIEIPPIPFSTNAGSVIASPANSASPSSLFTATRRVFNSPKKPLGGIENPIQLILKGNSLFSHQPLNPIELKDINAVLEQNRQAILSEEGEEVPSSSEEDGKWRVLYDPKTITRIIYPIETPGELKKTPKTKVGRGNGEGSSPRCQKGSTHKRKLFDAEESFCPSPQRHAETPKLMLSNFLEEKVCAEGQKDTKRRRCTIETNDELVPLNSSLKVIPREELERIVMAYDDLMSDMEKQLNQLKERAETLKRVVISLGVKSESRRSSTTPTAGRGKGQGQSPGGKGSKRKLMPVMQVDEGKTSGSKDRYPLHNAEQPGKLRFVQSSTSVAILSLSLIFIALKGSINK
ncbi:hypothetical protein DAPPUDRAFT_267039 [Daphnia pulex]|uniref:Uncharacterized protein n=1 Tax=Daphnia pulex TaxID=6669 RepID=E9HVW9_DAPPU|nr:hypothetical protein DAPPUDRAFT_267042 [Daphnia pulex]EFX64114.1 hypothetical protein DAPPUDRAFT_267039 [Daphnia pulex]|eukprot:EFX64113.1 hypothetical protein DAPPUDRAFT_267042 [Daphnia pulex]